jgi:hypothetical protein
MAIKGISGKEYQYNFVCETLIINKCENIIIEEKMVIFLYFLDKSPETKKNINP